MLRVSQSTGKHGIDIEIQRLDGRTNHICD